MGSAESKIGQVVQWGQLEVCLDRWYSGVSWKYVWTGGTVGSAGSMIGQVGQWGQIPVVFTAGGRLSTGHFPFIA